MQIIFNGKKLEVSKSGLAESAFLQELLSELNGKDSPAERYMVVNGYEDAADFYALADETTVIFIFDEHQTAYVDLINRSLGVFQAYIGDEKLLADNHFTFPLGYSHFLLPGKNRPIRSRDINVFFSGNLHVGRADFYRWLSRLGLPFPLQHRVQRLFRWKWDRRFPNSYIRFTSGFAEGLSATDYSAKLRNSKIVLCPGGSVSVESFRLYEALKSGCVVLTTPHPKRSWFDDAPVITVDRWENAGCLITDLLSSPARLEELSQAGSEWFAATVGPKALARRVRDNIFSAS